MDYKAEILKIAPPEVISKMQFSDSLEMYQEKECRNLNSLTGDLKGYDCEICKNKGVVYVVKGGCMVAQECKCIPVRQTLIRVRKSGLEDILKQNTFETYSTDEPWQERIKKTAINFLEDYQGNWFFIGGQVGAGKTHICTALVGEFINRGYAAKYMLWKDEATKLKSVVNDADSYEPLMYELKTIPVLYIDDFFKTSLDDRGNRVPPTQGDINLAFEILNYRYNQNKITIISSEMTIRELIACDEAVGSRIFQRTKKYQLSLSKDQNKNQRLKE